MLSTVPVSSSCSTLSGVLAGARVLFHGVFVVLLFAGVVHAGSPQRAEGHVVVKLRAKDVRALVGRLHADRLGGLAEQLRFPRGARLRETGLSRHLREGRPKGREDIDLARVLYVDLPHGVSPEDGVRILAGNPLVEYAEVDPVGHIGVTIPEDPDYGLQWYLTSNTSVVGRIHAPEAWDITTGTSSVIVAVIDTGCNTNLIEFSGRTVPGYDIYNNDSEPEDAHGHGTAVSAILAASANNMTNGVGVNWQCRVMPVKTFHLSSGLAQDTTDGIEWAVTNGADVINISAGWSTPYAPMQEALSNAVANGVIVVSISHNYATNLLTYPGRYPETIAVGAVDESGRRCDFSNYGPEVDLVAPGTNIYELQTTGGYGTNGWGTSYAAPQVSAVAALICSVRPSLSNEEARVLLCAGADDRVSSDTNDLSGFDEYYGWGRLNAYHSLLLARTRVSAVGFTNGVDRVIRWDVPPNAWTNRPFVVEYAPSPTSATWTVGGNVQYGPTTATWTDSAAVTSRFYRIGIRTN
jgi:subtilisin family serine protease